MRTTTHTGRLRRLRVCIQLIVAVLVLTWAPTVAQAAFFNVDRASVSVGTYRIPAPTGVNASANCPFLNPTMKVTITGFGAVNRASSYTATLTPPGAPEGTPQPLTANRTGSLVVSRALLSYPTMVLRIRAHIGSWVSDPFEGSISC